MGEPTLTLSGLFVSALLASTILPGGSEGVLLWLEHQQIHHSSTLLLVATLGNSLGGLSSWALGWLAIVKWPNLQKRFTLSPQASRWIEHHGAPVLLLSWLPLIGDALCIAAGWFQIRLLPALLFITIGKAARYGVLLWMVN